MVAGPHVLSLPEAARHYNAGHLAGGSMAGDSSSQAPSPPRVPDHTMLRQIGRGSYGDVWLARSVGGQLRAVKVVWRDRFSSDRPYEREFNGIRAFEPISRSHPGVIHILHLGRDEAAGCFYYVMELADSVDPQADYAPRTLASDLRSRGRLPVTEALAFGVQLADALGHLHRHRLVHRDVKPSNVVFVDGQAKIADIGLVTGADEARSFVGTEGFIPPEGPGSVQADIFGLGRVLYEATTGKDRCDFPELPDDLHGWNPAQREELLELNEILARACAPEASDRYANAAELAGDLNLLLAGRSIRRARGIEHRLRRATRVVGVAVLVALVALAAYAFQHSRRRQAEQRAGHEAVLRERAENAERRAQEELRESLLHQAQALLSSGEPDRRTRALESLREAAAIRTGLDLRNVALAALATPELRVVRRWDPRTPRGMESAPDARLERYVMRNLDGSVSVHSLATDAELLRLPSGGVTAAFAVFTPDGRVLAVRYDDLELRLWDLDSRTVRARVPGIRSLSFTPDSRRLLALSVEGLVHLVDVPSGREVSRFKAPEGAPALTAHPTEPLFAAWGYGGSELELRRVQDGRLLRRVPVPAMGLALAWSADGKQLFTAHLDYSIRVWEWPSLDVPRLLLHLHRAEPVSLATDPTSRWLVTGGWDTYAHVVDLRDGRVLLRETCQFVHVAGDRPAFLLSNQGDWRLVEFDPGHGFDAVLVHGAEKSPRDVAFEPSGRWLASAGPDGVRLLDRESRAVRELGRDPTLRVAFSADGTRLHAVSTSRLHAWRVHPGEGGLRADPLDLPGGGVRAFRGTRTAGLYPDGEGWLAVLQPAAGGGPSWIRGRFDTPEVEDPIPYVTGGNAPEISPDGRWLAWGSWQSEKAGATVRRLGSDDAPVWLPAVGSASVAFSPDNRLLAVGDSEQVRLHEVGTWRTLHAFPRRPNQPLPPSFAFTPDSRLCAAVLPPDRVLLVDARSGAELAVLPAGQHIVSRAAFSPDGRVLAAASTDHHVLLWDLEATRSRLRDLGLDW
jgi:serine/threonine protein kinase/WD40 repeat protein